MQEETRWFEAFSKEVGLDRLLRIEAAAKKWRESLAGDGWTEEDIESGMCRPGVAELLAALKST